jgi:hypothetical protein
MEEASSKNRQRRPDYPYFRVSPGRANERVASIAATTHQTVSFCEVSY